jgi:lipopolysaccharide transport system permease protein
VSLIPPSPETAGSLSELRALWKARRLLYSFVQHELQSRYLGGSVGLYWTIVHPLLQLATYTFVFHVLIGVNFHPEGGTTHYALFLFCGMITWNAFSEGLQRATTSLTDHSHLLRKMNFPAVVLPAKAVLTATLSQLIGLLILLIGALLLGDGISIHVVLIPLFVMVQAAFTLGLGLLAATMQAWYRDTSHWVASALFGGLFLTPVFYPASAYPRAFLLLLYPNPMAQLVGVYQGLLLNQRLPAFNQMLFPTVVALLVLGIGASVFSHNRRRFADLV